MNHLSFSSWSSSSSSLKWSKCRYASSRSSRAFSAELPDSPSRLTLNPMVASDLPAMPAGGGGLTLSQDTQARLARVPLPHHLTANPGCQTLNHHLANATTLPHHLANSSNQGSANHLITASPQFSSSTSPTRWRISPTRLDPTRSDPTRLDQTQLTPSPTPTCSPLPIHTSPSRRASDQGGSLRSGRPPNFPDPDISPNRRNPADHQAELINSHLAPASSSR